MANVYLMSVRRMIYLCLPAIWTLFADHRHEAWPIVVTIREAFTSAIKHATMVRERERESCESNGGREWMMIWLAREDIPSFYRPLTWELGSFLSRHSFAFRLSSLPAFSAVFRSPLFLNGHFCLNFIALYHPERLFGLISSIASLSYSLSLRRSTEVHSPLIIWPEKWNRFKIHRNHQHWPLSLIISSCCIRWRSFGG